MRIAITVDPYIPVPPKLYGGIERVVGHLVEGLVASGHEVFLLAHPHTKVSAELVPYGSPPHDRTVDRARELYQVSSWLWRRRNELDIVHSFGRLAALLPILPLPRLPKIQSYQRAVPWASVARTARLASGSLVFTSCSKALCREATAGQWETVHNCVDVRRYEFVSQVPEDAPLVFLGRLEAIKGTHEAIQIARRAGRGLVIAGNRVEDDGGYFEQKVEPFLDGEQIRYVGAVDDREKNDLLGRAAALLMPIDWEEPFGIVMAEALACGTPVIGFERGSVPEVVRNGETGFVVRDVSEAADAVARIPSLSREAARKDAESRFGASKMVRSYEELYVRCRVNCEDVHSETAPSTASSLPVKK